MLASTQGDYDRARVLYEGSLAYWRETGNPYGIATPISNLAITLCHQGEYDAARPLQEEALAVSRELGEREGIANCLSSLGAIAVGQGDIEAARSFYEESLQIRRELGNRESIAESLAALGQVARRQSDLSVARSFLTESLLLRRDRDDKPGMIDCLEEYAALLAAGGHPERAARLLGAVATLRSAHGISDRDPPRRPVPDVLEEVRSQLPEETFSAAHAAGQAMTLEDACHYALKRDR